MILLCAGLAAAGLAAELLLRYSQKPHQEGPPLILLQRDKPYKFLLNPEHTEINEQGLRDGPVQIPKPQGLYRILVLGDSVTFGLFVDDEEAYPHRLEKQLQTRDHPRQIEVINAGINGYTPYNQFSYYVEKGAAFDPDLVVVAFCFNDIVNPVRHWRSYAPGSWNLPLRAFPSGEQGARAGKHCGALGQAGALLRYIEERVGIATRMRG